MPNDIEEFIKHNEETMYVVFQMFVCKNRLLGTDSSLWFFTDNFPSLLTPILGEILPVRSVLC